MTTVDTPIEEAPVEKRKNKSCMDNNGSSRTWTGTFILIVGIAALLKSFILPLPEWLFTWQMLLIALGLFIGVRHSFRGGAWFILVLIGGIFLLDDFFPDLVDKRFIWPIALIAIGMFLIAKPRRRGRFRRRHMMEESPAPDTQHRALMQLEEAPHTDEDYIDSTTLFGGVKKNIISKNFKGGEVVNIMGGTEINLSQSDINGRVVLEVTQVFGGTKIIVPAHWDVKPDMAAIFGGIDDKRSIRNVEVDRTKVLVLKGTSVFGGIEVKAF